MKITSAFKYYPDPEKGYIFLPIFGDAPPDEYINKFVDTINRRSSSLEFSLISLAPDSCLAMYKTPVKDLAARSAVSYNVLWLEGYFHRSVTPFSYVKYLSNDKLFGSTPAEIIHTKPQADNIEAKSKIAAALATGKNVMLDVRNLPNARKALAETLYLLPDEYVVREYFEEPKTDFWRVTMLSHSGTPLLFRPEEPQQLDLNIFSGLLAGLTQVPFLMENRDSVVDFTYALAGSHGETYATKMLFDTLNNLNTFHHGLLASAYNVDFFKQDPIQSLQIIHKLKDIVGEPQTAKFLFDILSKPITPLVDSFYTGLAHSLETVPLFKNNKAVSIELIHLLQETVGLEAAETVLYNVVNDKPAQVLFGPLNETYAPELINFYANLARCMINIPFFGNNAAYSFSLAHKLHNSIGVENSSTFLRVVANKPKSQATDSFYRNLELSLDKLPLFKSDKARSIKIMHRLVNNIGIDYAAKFLYELIVPTPVSAVMERPLEVSPIVSWEPPIKQKGKVKKEKRNKR